MRSRGVVVAVVVGMLEIGDWYEGFYKPFHEMVDLAVIRILRYYRRLQCVALLDRSSLKFLLFY